MPPPTTTNTAPADIAIGAIGYQALNYNIGAGFKAQMTTTAQSSTQAHYNIVISKRTGTIDIIQVTSFNKIKAKVNARRKAHSTSLGLEQKLSTLVEGTPAYKSSFDQLEIQRNKLRTLPASVSDHFDVQYQLYAMAIQGDEWSPSGTILNPGNTGIRGFVILDSLTPMNVPVSRCSCFSYITLTLACQIDIANVGVLPVGQVPVIISARAIAGLCEFGLRSRSIVSNRNLIDFHSLTGLNGDDIFVSDDMGYRYIDDRSGNVVCPFVLQ
jgi:hypothetical protein